MQTPPRANQSSGQPLQAPKTPNQPIVGFVEPPPVVRCSKKRRGNNIIETDPTIVNLWNLFNQISLEPLDQ
jgi:hypothetical protein